jgi:hypothetical protein
MDEKFDSYEETAQQAVDLANRIADQDQNADLWDIADGLLAGAVHYWLYTRQPCEDPLCEDCISISSPDERLLELLRFVEELAKDSEYFHSAHDARVGRA